MSLIPVTYVTSSPHKREELEVILRECQLKDGRSIRDAYDFELVDNTIQETLEVSIEALVSAEVADAYRQLKRPCIVEHAGLIFAEYKDQSYPGGLTKPMWNTLGLNFVRETGSANRKVFAKAVVGYCDGKQCLTFSGLTEGTLAETPRGHRDFYWDTVFVPAMNNDARHTYAEIIESEGLAAKIARHSQSAKALVSFLNWRLTNTPSLWDVSF